MGLISGIVARFSQQKIAQEFVVGLKDFAFSAIVIGLARGVLVIADNGMIIDTILNAMATGLSDVAPAVYTTILYVVENLLTILVPSSSSLAALTMPIFGPLTELVGLNPEGAVTALCLAEPMMTIIAPTSAIHCAGLAVWQNQPRAVVEDLLEMVAAHERGVHRFHDGVGHAACGVGRGAATFFARPSNVGCGGPAIWKSSMLP